MQELQTENELHVQTKPSEEMSVVEWESEKQCAVELNQVQMRGSSLHWEGVSVGQENHNLVHIDSFEGVTYMFIL